MHVLVSSAYLRDHRKSWTRQNFLPEIRKVKQGLECVTVVNNLKHDIYALEIFFLLISPSRFAKS